MGTLGTVTKFICDPISTLLILMMAALLMMRLRFGMARALMVFATLYAAALVFLAVGPLLAAPLENRHPRPAALPHVEGILVLSGGINRTLFRERGDFGQDSSEPRLAAGAELARRFPQAKLVFSGTETDDPAGKAYTAEVVRRRFAALGVAPERVIVEIASRDTWQGVRFSHELLHPGRNDVWVLVTQAVHMPRSMGVARKIGWNVVPWPCDYLSVPQPSVWALGQNPSANAYTAYQALREWFGLLGYRLQGRI